MRAGAFVGRTRELSRLTRVAVDARSGRGSVVTLVGEAGIGKTRLAEEAASVCAGLGSEVLWATCREEGAVPAYFPWRELLRAHADHVGADAFAHDLGEWEPVVSALLPPASSPGAQPRSPPAAERLEEGLDPDGTRFRLFEALTELMRRAAARKPLVLVLDDLHWADVPSLLLLRFLVRDVSRRRILVIGTHRDLDLGREGERGRLLADLGSPGATLHLGELSPDEVGELIAGLTDRLPPSRLTSALRARAGGNPLFVLELASLPFELWEAHPQLGVPATSIPQRVRLVLEHRMASLPGGCRAVIEAASVIGIEVDVDVLAGVLGRPLLEILDALEQAAAASVVAAPARPGSKWTFRHGLVRDLLYSELEAERRRTLHRAVADTLEALTHGEKQTAELAHHFLQASSGGDTARAVHYCEEAGRQAMRLLAYEEAAEHFDRALSVLAEDRSTDPRRVELFLLTGEARMRAGDLPGARAAFVAAAQEARRRGRSEELARAALGFGAGLGGFEVRVFDEEQLQMLEDALAALGEEDSPLRAWVLARLSVALSFVESSERRRYLSEEAVAVARRVGDVAALAHALASRCDALAGPSHAEQRREDASEIVRLARAVPDRGLELLGRRLRVVATLELGDMAGVDAEIETFARVAAAVRQPIYQWYVPLWRAMRAIIEGRLDDAERHNAAAAEIGARAQSQNAEVLVASQRLLLACERGDLVEGERVLRAMFEQGMPTGYSGGAWLAALVARQGRVAEARALLGRLVAGDLAELPEEDAEWLPALCQLAHACEVVRVPQAAELLYERLLPHRHRFVVDGIAAGWLGSVERYLGLLAASLGRYDDAEGHFEAALSENLAAGSPLVAAHVLCDQGTMLARTARSPEDAERAVTLLRESATTYRSLGLDRVAAGLDRLAGEAGRKPAGEGPPGHAFRREGGMWTLAFAGREVHLTDAKGLRDIARLLASPGVEIHVLDLVGNRLREADTGDALDERAVRDYRARLAELEADLESVEAGRDLQRIEDISRERDFLVREISVAFGLGGRPRRTNDPAERARTAVAWRIRDSLRKIDVVHPALARHLRNSIRTGIFCSYQPEQPLDWRL